METNVGNLGFASWLLKFASGNLGRRPLWAKSWPGAFWSQIWAIWACQLAIEICFWKPWEKAFLGQILARSLLKPDFGFLELKLAVWTMGNPNFAQNRLEPKGGTLTQKQAPKPKIAFKKPCLDPTLPRRERSEQRPEG